MAGENRVMKGAIIALKKQLEVVKREKKEAHVGVVGSGNEKRRLRKLLEVGSCLHHHHHQRHQSRKCTKLTHTLIHSPTHPLIHSLTQLIHQLITKVEKRNHLNTARELIQVKKKLAEKKRKKPILG